MFKIEERLKEILKEATGEGGKLEGVKKVYIGDVRLLPSNAYPAISILVDGIKTTGVKYRCQTNLTYMIYLLSIGANIDNSRKQVEELLWKEKDVDCNGLIPLLYENLGIVVDGNSYKLDVGEVKIIQGRDQDERFTTLASVPIRIETWKRMVM